MTVRLSQLLDPARIALAVPGAERPAAIDVVARLLDPHPDVTDAAAFRRELLAREELVPTSLGNGVALPHVRTDHVRRIVAAIGRCPEGVPGSVYGTPDRLLVVLGAPKTASDDYLVLVGSLCRIMKQPGACEALLAAPTPEAFLATLTELEQRVLGPGA